MDVFLVLKTVHVISSTVLFGTGLGIAYFCLTGLRSSDDRMALFAMRSTCKADMIFTLAAGIVQPISGLALAWIAGYDICARWMVATYVLYLISLACWLPVVWLQLRICYMLADKVAGEPFDAIRFARFGRAWFALGWPAFAALIAVFWLMVAKPG